MKKVRSSTGYLTVIVACLMFMTVPAARSAEDEGGLEIWAGPDLEVADIWHLGNWEVGCTIVNNGEPYIGEIIVNLTLPEMGEQSYILDWTGEGSHQNVTFEAGFQYENGQLEISASVELEDGVDANTSDNERTETWNIESKDLSVESIALHPHLFDLSVNVHNLGFAHISHSFHIALYIDDMFEHEIKHDGGVHRLSVLSIPMNWTWDGLTPVKISVRVDSWDEILELNETNNHYLDVWYRNTRLFFTQDLNVTHIGINNATVNWSTSLPVTWHLQWGPGNGMMRRTIDFPSANNGTFEFTSLSDSTFYYFQFYGRDNTGRSIFDWGGFITEQAVVADPPTGSLPGGDVMTYSPSFDLPVNVFDDKGINSIDIYVDDEFIGSYQALGAMSLNGIPFDLGPYRSGNHNITLVITDVEGNKRIIGGGLVWEMLQEMDYPLLEVQTLPRPYHSKTSLLKVNVEDPGGIQNVTWYVDGVPVFVDEPDGDHATYSSNFWWNTASVSNGAHTVTVEVYPSSNLARSSNMDVVVNNGMDVESSDIEIIRAPLTSNGTTVTVGFDIFNTGSETVENLIVEDRIRGFIPISGFEDAFSMDEDGTIWVIRVNAGLIPSGESIRVTYEVVPILTRIPIWSIGLPMGTPGNMMRMTTTKLIWNEQGSDQELRSYELLSGGHFNDGSAIQEGTWNVIKRSNYVMLTNPERLFDRMVVRENVDELLVKAGQLSNLKTGVMVFVHEIDEVPYTEEFVLTQLIALHGYLHPQYPEMGYLAILGEMDIIPAWDYDSGDIPASDHGYSNLKGGDEPEVIVGRFIGDSVEEILPQLDTSIGVMTGELLNDPTGSALLTSGGWNGMMEYYPNTEDLRNHIEPLMDDVTTVHISDVIDLNKME
ncbi:MAG: CARDB domain-containing protein, partial [Candidatus Thermoplasmatota archaeon]|nr:CARDB domain-containing protein [Candidatus Thermoplasmatota archaeon]